MKTFFLIFLLSIKSFATPVSDELSAWDIESQNMISPFTTPAAWIMGLGTVAAYFVYQDKKRTDGIGYNPDFRNREKKNWEKAGDVLGWGLLQGAYTLLQLPGISDGDQKSLENVEIMWKSTLYTSLTTLALKIGINEERQTTKGKMESFPSGHASAAFAFATNVALRHKWYWNLASGPLALLAATSRVSSKDHYVHDAIFGAALGMSFAYGVNYLHETKGTPLLLGYEPMSGGGGVTMKYSF